MKYIDRAHILYWSLLLTLISLGFLNQSTFAQQNTKPDQSEIWVSAYLASWNHFAPPTGNWGNLPTEQIDWDAFTHLFYFAFSVKSDGSLSEVAPYENLNADRINSVVTAAHKKGKPVLFTVGGWGNRKEFTEAIDPEIRDVFIDNLLQILQKWNFDGIDLDLEPIKDEDLKHYRQFIEELYQKLQQIKTHKGRRPLLTVATDTQPEFFAEMYSKFDQVNLMTYDYSGAWEGWVSWHNAPVHSSQTFPGKNKPLPSIDESVQKFLEAGVPPSKLGIGIDYYGYVWHGGSGTSAGGVTKPGQTWEQSPSVTDNVPYHEIMKKYFDDDSYHWDEDAKAAYLSIDQPGSKNDKFISYDDERSIRAKFEYVEKNNLGGVIIWELGGGYRKQKPAGQRDLLLQQVKNIIRN